MRNDLAMLLFGERFCQLSTGEAALHSTDAHEGELWSGMYELERQTLHGVERFLLITTRIHLAGCDWSTRLASQLVPGCISCPGQRRCRVTELVTTRYLSVLRRLAREFRATPSAAFFDYVLAHEQAIRETTRRERDHREDSLQPIEDLLGKVPEAA
jgi:hypothetical protein